MSKAGIHAVLLPSATAKSLRSRNGEYVRICHNIFSEVLIILNVFLVIKLLTFLYELINHS